MKDSNTIVLLIILFVISASAGYMLGGDDSEEATEFADCTERRLSTLEEAWGIDVECEGEWRGVIETPEVADEDD